MTRKFQGGMFIGKSIPGFPQRNADIEDSLRGIEAACVEARMSADTLNDEEQAAFPGFNQAQRKKEYLHIRNAILKVWNQNPGEEVTLEAATRSVQKIEYQNKELINSILIFLIRRGRINHGVFREAPKAPPVFAQRQESIAILGAGMSGIIAAKQLRYLGFKVTVIEPMQRFGGRVCTYRTSDMAGAQWHGELGAMVVTGLPGNPIHTLSRQFRFDLKKIRNECPLYADGNAMTSTSVDKKTEDFFNTVLEGIVSLRDKEQFQGQDLSLNDLVNKFLMSREADVKEKLNAHQKELSDLYKRILKHEDNMASLRDKMKKLADKMKGLKEREAITTSDVKSDTKLPSEDEVCVFQYLFSKNRVDLAEKIEQYKRVKGQCAKLQQQVDELEQNPPPQVFINSLERRMFDWHVANLEYANATSISKLSFKNWDQDDSYEFPGDHYVISNGYDFVVEQIVQKCKESGVEFKLGFKAEKVTVNKENQKVEVKMMSTDKSKRLKRDDEIDETDEPLIFDAVLCTVPLGILKANKIDFSPPLPEWKQDSIKRLGYGNLNKVVLHFEERFWEDKLDTFGILGPSSSSRGEFYLFFSVSKKEPVLTALLSGDSADVAEDTADDLIVRRAIILLKEIFGSKSVARTKLRNYVITRWKANEYIMGAYSFMAVGASGDDYDQLAAPVESTAKGGGGIYFAGEHTNRHYPATVHGAYLSGLREAGRIADRFCDTPYSLNTINN